MKKTLLLSLLATAMMITTLGSAQAAGGNIEIPRQDWSWDGILGSYDRAESQRGLQVYREVCAGCHGLRFVAFRNLMQLGYSENQVKALAAE